MLTTSRDRIVVSTLRCGRNNPGSNPGHGRLILLLGHCTYTMMAIYILVNLPVLHSLQAGYLISDSNG